MFKAVIPARYASTRLPGKPLLDIAGKPMVVRVAERARLSDADEVIVATDHPEIRTAVEAEGFTCLMTRSDWPTGTDRIAEVTQMMGWRDDTVVVNVQGDEPLIDPDLINEVATALLQGTQDISTCAHPISTWEEFINPNVVKIALSETGEANYFSRAPIPFPRDTFTRANWPEDLSDPVAYRHIGLYAYTVRFLNAFQNLKPSVTERLESLEQLRALSYGYRIKVCMIHEVPAAGVDTQEDLNRIRQLFGSK